MKEEQPELFQTEYKSKYVARITSSGKLLFSGPNNDLVTEPYGWYSTDSGSSPDCMFIMDNKQFNRMMKVGEVELINRL